MKREEARRAAEDKKRADEAAAKAEGLARERASLESFVFPETQSSVPRATLDLGGLDVSRKKPGGSLASLLGLDQGGDPSPARVTFEDAPVERKGYHPNLPVDLLTGLARKKLDPESSRDRDITPQRVRKAITEDDIKSGRYPKDAKPGQIYEGFDDPRGIGGFRPLAPERSRNRGDEDVASKFLFGLPYDDLTTSEERRRTLEYADSRVGTRARERERGKRDVAIPPKDRSKLRVQGPNGELELLPPGMTWREAEGENAVEFSEKEFRDIAQGGVALDAIYVLDGASRAVNEASDALARIPQGAAAWAGAKLQSDKAAEVLSGSLSALSTILGRRAFQDSGALSNVDTARLIGALPGLSDVSAVSQFKIRTLRLLVDGANKRLIAIKFGQPFDEKAWSEEKNDMLNLIDPEGERNLPGRDGKGNVPPPPVTPPAAQGQPTLRFGDTVIPLTPMRK
jgi:hypothetical protein